ncbi:histidine kinase [Psychromonas antarctica]|uniref:histidine kinase n=1 Tax=Psychromonas antarctica TaxID=67573 RepID=UPI001EE96404|nr:histidine kinase [Psychromonas antarctica]MCG6201238.1 histidine kinase [Psychromonas antarctica]
MKIHLLMPLHSLSKVIINTSALILIVSAIHILTVLGSFDRPNSDINSINQLIELKMGTVQLIYANRYHPEELPRILATIERKLIPAELLQSSWFNTQSFNQKSNALLTHWEIIKSQIMASKYTQVENNLSNFQLSVNNLILQYQKLARKKMNLIHFIELLEFLVIACAGLFLYYYSKKQIAAPIKQLLGNIEAIKGHHFSVKFPDYKNEIGALSLGVDAMSKEIKSLIEDMQDQVKQKTIALEQANKTIEFLFLISKQLSSVKLTSPVLYDALNALANQANLTKVCLELNNGTFVNSALGCASLEPDLTRIPIIVNARPYGFLNYVAASESDHASLIESFTGIVARALYQEENSLQAQKILLMEERSIIARELHDSIAQSLSFLKIQCTLLHRQVSGQVQATQTISNIEAAVTDAYKQLRSLLSTFRLSVPESNFKEALLTMVKGLQVQTPALIVIKKFATHFYTDASQHIHLLQIIREAIINAIKHAQCSTIEISCIITDEHKVWISVIDDGMGIKDNDQNEHNYGLAIIKQRADELGATLSLNQLSKGTEVKLIFPYKNRYLIKE